MGKGSILAAVALLLAWPSLAQSPHSGHCTVSLDRSKLALGWVDPMMATHRDPLRAVAAGCMTCSPVLTVAAFAEDNPESESETIEQHTMSLLTDREAANRWLVDAFERGRKPDRVCQFADKTMVDGRTIAGLSFYGAHAAQRCTVGQTTITMMQMFYYEAVGAGCRFIVGVTSKGGSDLSDQNRAAADRALEGIHFSYGK